MSQAPYWPVATDALIADTMCLSTEEFGAYLRLMIAQWRNNGKPLPPEDDRLARMAGLSRRAWKRVRPVIADFFSVSETGWSQKRVEKDFAGIICKIEKNRQNGSRGGKAKSLKNKNVGLANATNSLCISPERNAGELPTNHNHNHNHNQDIKDLSSLRSDRCKSSQPHSEPQPQPKPEPEISGNGQSQPSRDAPRPVERSPAVALRVIDGTRPAPGAGVSQVRTRRGSRWPDDAVVPDDWLREGEMRRVEHSLPMVDVRLEAEKFQNHWSSSSGQSAIKVDWHKTWINWVLRANSNVRTNGYAVEEHPARTAARRILAEMYGGGQA